MFHYRKSDPAEICHLLALICYLSEQDTGGLGGGVVAALLYVQDHTQTAPWESQFLSHLYQPPLTQPPGCCTSEV